jgi:hypothetical protein
VTESGQRVAHLGQGRPLTGLEIEDMLLTSATMKVIYIKEGARSEPKAEGAKCKTRSYLNPSSLSASTETR